ncbi:hypothetical protein [Limnobacter parvus]|uniref:Uncharacterized protein n=1 Tax=Limnobacter parvus TaxID=2939690 RepID=A0ABT1XE04_9BURK|nr:hypothetical protein [Limnobacter parvus]MCR2745511.1 hypothetical protein [Limnobacter parvus]
MVFNTSVSKVYKVCFSLMGCNSTSHNSVNLPIARLLTSTSAKVRGLLSNRGSMWALQRPNDTAGKKRFNGNAHRSSNAQGNWSTVQALTNWLSPLDLLKSVFLDAATAMFVASKNPWLPRSSDTFSSRLAGFSNSDSADRTDAEDPRIRQQDKAVTAA